MNKHHESTGPEEQQVTLRSAGELADALPYVLGYHPSDSIVVVALHGSRGRFGARVQSGIPRSPLEWPSVAEQLAECLIEGSERRGCRPDGIVLFLCQDPARDESARAAMERLRPLSQLLRTACGSRDVPVYEALCISDRRFWSYCCPDARCCPLEGNALVAPGTSVMAAAATYAGVQVRGSQREMEVRLEPPLVGVAPGQLGALDSAGEAMVIRLLGGGARCAIADETIALAREMMGRIARSPRASDGGESDAADDALLTVDEAAALIHGLQDRETRDHVAAWADGSDAEPALRLWRALSRRCVGPYGEYAAPPLTLAGWIAWSLGDKPAARVAFDLALRRDPAYVLARLFQQACNEGLDLETVRTCLQAGQRTTEVAAERDAGRQQWIEQTGRSAQTPEIDTAAVVTAARVVVPPTSTAEAAMIQTQGGPRQEAMPPRDGQSPEVAQGSNALEDCPRAGMPDGEALRERPRRMRQNRPPAPSKPRRPAGARPGKGVGNRGRRSDPSDRQGVEQEG
ncbi:DUF4192 family protein [Streptomyces albipurpureus]|uniref:DUF4192 domain-containing protein n=1 Tax=Streptomyces albipurpureus TaxID=2897419 RepID=A0ABT0UJ81_9ACTN|nr:DUF4192 domain-containing protein [Streptomyces sp. CWNU-1]MCM2388396.1 DUF4192 domain-containing protein [Streptomyces sp. CWNU-1]